MQRFFRIPEWAWLALGLALRAGMALKLDGRIIQIDENAFDAAAWSLAASGHYGPQPISALPPLFFALFYLAGHYPVLPRLGQALASTAAAWALGRATGELTDSERAGRLALALASIYPFFIYYSSTLMSETLYLACLTAGVWELARSLKGKDSTLGAAARAGLWLGTGALARSEGAYIWAVIWAVAGLASLRGYWSRRAWLAAVLCWLIPIAAWSARNRAAAGRFALDLHGGVTLLHGTMFFELNEQDTALAIEALRREPFYRESEGLPEGERDAVLRREAFRFMREHPVQTLGQWWAKVVSFWRFYPRTDKTYAERTGSQPAAGAGRWLLTAISLLFEPWLILGGLAGLALLVRRDPRLFPLPLFVLGTMGIHILSVSQMRYRLPVMPWLIMGACWLIAERLKPGDSTTR